MAEIKEGFSPQLIQAEFEMVKKRPVNLTNTYERFFGPEYAHKLLNSDTGLNHKRSIEEDAVTIMEIEDSIARSHRFVCVPDDLARKFPDLAVGFLYKTLLLRDADPEGKATYVSQLKSGKPMEQVIHSLTNSPEYRRKAIIRLYSELLGRAPDERGYKDKYSSRKPIGVMAKEIRASQEYTNRNGNS